MKRPRSQKARSGNERAVSRTMGPAEAVRRLHERHPGIVHAPDGTETVEDLHLEVFWLTGSVHDAMVGGKERSLRRYFRTMEGLLAEGTSDVLLAVLESFLQHIVLDPRIAWARTLMPPELEAASRFMEAELRWRFERCRVDREKPA